MSFLLRLGFLTQGAAYPLAELPQAEQAVARDMQLFGLLYFIGDTGDEWCGLHARPDSCCCCCYWRRCPCGRRPFCAVVGCRPRMSELAGEFHHAQLASVP